MARTAAVDDDLRIQEIATNKDRSEGIKIDERYMEETFYRHCSGLNWILDCQLRQF